MDTSGRLWRVGARPRVRGAGLSRRALIGGGITVAAAGALAAAAVTVGGSALAAGQPGPGGRALAPTAVPEVTTTAVAGGYQFVELGSHQDRTYNQFFSINDNGRISASYGFGDKGHPSKGYTIVAPYAQRDVKAENYPHAVQTEVFGLNDSNVQVGEYSTQNDANSINDPWFGWYYNGSFHKVVFPAKHNASPVDDELAGVNNHDIAVGSYENSPDHFQGFTFNIKTGKYTALTLPGVPASTTVFADGINNSGDIVGQVGADGFIKLAGGGLHRIVVPGAAETIAFSVNDNDTVVGAYLDSSNRFHGFIWRIGGSLTTFVDDPNADGPSYLSGINDEGDVVGSYQDSSGHMDAFLAFPAF